MARNKSLKRSIDEIMAEIPDPKSVKFEPLPIPSKHPAILHLPPNIDFTDPYALFTLFWPESLWQTIAINTNMYAIEKRTKSNDERLRLWHEVNSTEIKIFVGILIY